MDIIVCMKQVIDTEAPASLFKVDTEKKRAIPPVGTPPVLNPFDENALEAALKVKDNQSAQITVLSMGQNLAIPVVKKALAAGADELILLDDDAFADLDSYSAAYILANSIKKLGKYDLIICGREAADTDAGLVGPGIAEILGIPSITLASKIEVNGKEVQITRILSDAYEVIQTTLPALVTSSNEIGELRYPSIKDRMAAKKIEPIIWGPGDINLESSYIGELGRKERVIRLFQPVHEGECEFIEGEDLEDIAKNLALRMRESKII